MIITTPYYEDLTRISNSNIGLFIKHGPAHLKRVLDGKEEPLNASYLSRGSMIHMYLLQQDEFWDKYYLYNGETPSSKQQKDFIEALINSTEIEPNKAVLEAYKSVYSTTGQSDDKVLTKALELAEKLSDYTEAIKTKKEIISGYGYSMLKTIKTNIDRHKLASTLMENVSCAHNEFHINWEFPKTYNGINLPCKSLLDRLILDTDNKKITLIDLKTSFDVNNFSSSIDSYDYLRQLSYYWLATLWYVKNELKVEITDDWELRTYIIAIDTQTYQVRVFEFTEKQLEPSLQTIEKTIKEICWHYDTDLWEQRREYYEGDGSETLKLCV